MKKEIIGGPLAIHGRTPSRSARAGDPVIGIRGEALACKPKKPS